jgi:acetyl esterase/lipase
MQIDAFATGKKEASLPKSEIPTIAEGHFLEIDEKWSHPDLMALFQVGHLGDIAMQQNMIIDPTASREERVVRKAAWLSNFPGVDEISSGEDNSDDPMTRTFYSTCGLYDEDPKLQIIVVRPKALATQKKLPVIFHIGQGALINNNFVISSLVATPLAIGAGAAIVFVCARTGIEATMPAPIDDYEAGYRWLLENGKDIGLDTDNIVLFGESGGAYAALCFAFRCKKVGFKPKGALCRGPIVSDSMTSKSSIMLNDAFNNSYIQRAFRCILNPGDHVSPYVSPEIMPGRATVEDCCGLCPLFLHTFELDPQRDDVIDFAKKLYETHVYTSLHVWDGALHCAFAVPGPGEINEAYDQLCICQIKDMFRYDFRREWLQD